MTAMGLSEGGARFFGPLCVAVALGIVATLAGSWFEDRIELRAGFRLKDAVGRAATLPQNLKIIAFDDQFLQNERRSDITYGEWTQLLRGLSDRGVRRVYIDKRFSLLSDPGASEAFVAAVAALPIQVAAAGWSVGQLVSVDTLLDQVDGSSSDALAPLRELGEKHFGLTRQHIYGPHPKLYGAFAAVGLIDYRGDGRLQAMAISTAGRVVPGLPLSLSSLAVSGSDLIVDGKALPVDTEGRYVANLPSFDTMLRRTLSVAPILDALRSQRPLTPFGEGDAVVIIPGFYTGSTDFVQTPRGVLPGGFVVSAGVANIMNGDALAPVRGAWILTFLFPIVVLMMTLRLSGRWIFAAWLAASSAMAAVGLGAFAYANLLLPWLAPVTSGCLTALTALIVRHRQAEREIARIRAGLAGVVPAVHLEHLVAHPETAQLEVVGKVVSVMFVDVAGFSRVVGDRTPREAYDLIKSMVDRIASVVHQHGGCVDRALGDGLLCYFGHNHSTITQDGNHAQQAVLCAVDIQRRFLAEAMAQSAGGELPLRIGINTCPVVFGDLGNAQRRDPTLVGDGVNFAKRLESACDLYRVCISHATRSMLALSNADFDVRARLVPVKHFEDPIEVFEIEPNADHAVGRRQALKRYFERLGLGRQETRDPFMASAIVFAIGGVPLNVRNVSQGGFGVELPRYYGNGAVLSFQLTSIDRVMAERLERFGLGTVLGEVRWAEPLSDRCFLHGVRIKNLSPRQRAELHDLLTGKEISPRLVAV